MGGFRRTGMSNVGFAILARFEAAIRITLVNQASFRLKSFTR